MTKKYDDQRHSSEPSLFFSVAVNANYNVAVEYSCFRRSS